MGNLQVAIEKIEKEYGKGAIMKMDSGSVVNVDVISSGSYSIDDALGVGGYPRGRIIEIFGAESSGKTTLALHAIAEAQKGGGVAAFIDAEHAFDPTYASNIGVDVPSLYISQPDNGEQALSIAETLIKSGDISILVVDSVAALVPRSELDGEMGESNVGVQARLMSQAMRKLVGAVSKSGTCLIFINQLREKIGVMFGNPQTTTGGNALKFYASIRIEISRSSQPLKDSDGEAVASRTKIKVVKNKLAAPFRVAEFDILYGKGISKSGEILDFAVACGAVSKSGSWYAFESSKLGQGREAVIAIMNDNPDLCDMMIEAINSKKQ